jgi:D-alanyl-D-alanine dipeptidase
MSFSRRAVLLLSLSACAHTPSVSGPGAAQLVVVLVDDWNSPNGTATLYERTGTAWTARRSSPVVVGKNGLGWGRGEALQVARGEGEPVKQEGDGRAPAGLFRLGSAFGQRSPGGSWPFRVLRDTTECVDDVASAQYARTVERDVVTVEWKSSEKMASESLYRLGAFVEHNTSPPSPGAGSCIFLHVWREPGRGTAGCTAFPEEALEALLRELRPEAQPLLLQLPRAVYATHRVAQGWP